MMSQRDYSLFIIVYILYIIDIAIGDHFKTQQNWEQVFLSIPSEARAYEHLAVYTSAPHPAGTPEDKAMAEFTLQKFREFGLNDSQIIPFNVLLSYPNRRSLQMISPVQFTASLKEDEIPQDPTTYDSRIIPTFNGYSPSGNVTAELVYLNYASLDDFAKLEALGVDVKGKIGIARYGGLFRGTKAMIAQQKGMIGLILYSDPADDGFVQGKTFPDGPWRPKSGVQRGSVQFLSICPGDPSRPICSNDPNYNYTQGIPNIPVQPISWGDAYPLLKNLGGKAVPPNFQGGLNITYKTGPGPTKINLFLDMNFVVAPIWNVIATITGQVIDRFVILGNHRDAWVFGATDPNSGTATLLEVARGLGDMLKQGWVPQRSIILASWDGEEYGLLGSTAWAEANANLLQKQAVAYLNVDVAVTGNQFGVSATHSLDRLIDTVANEVIDPNTGKPISAVWGGNISDLGSGSDYTAFIDHFGVASTDMGFNGPYGVYHSTYDDIHWMNEFGDPTYSYHKTCAQFWGLMALKLVDSPLIPFNYTTYATALVRYYQQIVKLLQEENHQMSLTELQDAVSLFTKAANDVDQDMRNWNGDPTLNDRLILTERTFLSDSGLPKRPYYKHVIQAPGIYEGYASQTFPGLYESIADKDWEEATVQYKILYQQINTAAAFLAGGG